MPTIGEYKLKCTGVLNPPNPAPTADQVASIAQAALIAAGYAGAIVVPIGE